jgi:hypothetical protein
MNETRKSALGLTVHYYIFYCIQSLSLCVCVRCCSLHNAAAAAAVIDYILVVSAAAAAAAVAGVRCCDCRTTATTYRHENAQLFIPITPAATVISY